VKVESPLRKRAHSILGLVSALALLAGNANADFIELIQVGTWTENPGNFQPSSGSELQQGGKFVIKTGYNQSDYWGDTLIFQQEIGGRTFHVAELSSGTAGDTGGSQPNCPMSLPCNYFDVLVPMEGFDSGGVPFVYHQTATDHLNFAGDPYASDNTRIHFDAPGGDPADFAGYRFEGGFAPGALNNFVQIQTEISDSETELIPGTFIERPVASQVVNIRFEENPASYPMVIRSVDGIASALPAIAEAGPDLSYDAATLLATTGGGTSQDNDLGAGRSDKEDFLTHTWTLVGSVENGPIGASLVGDDIDGMRPDGRAVENVNKAVEIANSGLASTTDVAIWQIAVTEALTEFDGGTDTLFLSYENALPIVALALATPVGNDILFELTLEDVDLAINGLGLTDFELLEVELKHEGLPVTALADLIDVGAQLKHEGLPVTALADLIDVGAQYVDFDTLVALFGEGDGRLEVRVSDRNLREEGGFVSAFINFTVVPEPGTAMLVLAGLAGLGMRSARQRHRAGPSA